jgi:hypothetical protein
MNAVLKPSGTATYIVADLSLAEQLEFAGGGDFDHLQGAVANVAHQHARWRGFRTGDAFDAARL